ncbi:hypothetical protein [Rhodococcus aetherivorans]|uniref:hypothetical protein n=1 Tax=Rhodococcus aetherivorans TaxID=191292 RepID=UPI00388CF432
MPWTTDNDQTTTAIAEIITPLVGDMALAMVDDQLRELGNQLAPNRAILTLPKLNDRAAHCDPAIVWQDEHGHATVLEGKNGILPHVTGPLDVLGTLRLAAAIVATAVRRVTADS